jgi:hypothetical protein
MEKKPHTTVEATDIPVPAFDTPTKTLTPIVDEAIKAGAKLRAHPDDATMIIVAIKDKKDADEFEAAIKAALKAVE